MRLTLPLHRQILEIMEDGDAYNPVRVHHILKQEYGQEFRREYVGQELGNLRDVELVRRVPPENSGLYRVSQKGRAALYRFEHEGDNAEFSLSDLVRDVQDGKFGDDVPQD